MNWRFFYILYFVLAKNLPESRRMPVANKLRHFFAKHIMKYCAENANIEKGAHFGPEVSIGSRSNIGVNCQIYGSVIIGNDVMMGPECVIFTNAHRHDRIDIPMIEQGNTISEKVVIEDDVWIGQRCMIMPGCIVAKGCILAAGAVLTRNTTPYSIWGGVPAHKLKDREGLQG